MVSARSCLRHEMAHSESLYVSFRHFFLTSALTVFCFFLIFRLFHVVSVFFSLLLHFSYFSDFCPISYLLYSTILHIIEPFSYLHNIHLLKQKWIELQLPQLNTLGFCWHDYYKPGWVIWLTYNCVPVVNCMSRISVNLGFPFIWRRSKN
jgi:hypothetical protein